MYVNKTYLSDKMKQIIKRIVFILNVVKIQFLKVQKLLEIIWLGHFFFQSGALFSNRYERDAHTSRDKFTTK